MYSKNFMKKIGSVALAGVMAASLSIPAFAAADTTNTTTKIDGKYEEIPIAVTVPKTGTAQINPYGLPVEFKNLSADTTKVAKVSGQQIVTQPLYISNDGDVALSVGATVTTTAKGLEIVSSKDTIAKSTEKQAYVELQLAPSAQTTLDTDAAKDKVTAEYATDTIWANASALALSTDDAVSKKGLATLAASKVTTTQDDEGKDVTTIKYAAGGICLIRLAGEVVTEPETAWSTNDSFSSTIAFTFTPTTTTDATT
jgi:hypothetical protein